MPRFAALTLFVLLASPALAVDITTCALGVPGGTLETVPAGQVAVLQADLSGCHYAVALEDNATLQLNSHVISGCGMFAVACRGRRCTIEGPGEITGGDCNVYEDNSLRNRRMTVRNVDVHDTSGALGGVGTRLRLENVTVTRQSESLSGADAASRIAVSGGVVVGTNVTVTDNIGLGIFASRRLILDDSTLTGNHGYGEDYDFVSIRRPRLVNVTCGVGVDGVDRPWGLCANDP